MSSTEELLSNEEMSALLSHQNDAGDGTSEKKSRIVPYNFRRPDRLSKDQIRGLYLLHDSFANNLSSSLPLFLRTFCEVTLISVDQQSYAEYVKGVADPTTLFTFTTDTLRGTFAIELSNSVAFPIIDKMLGGEGNSLEEQRAATELELKILDELVSVVTDNYCEVWKQVIEMKTEITGRETRPQLIQIVSPNEVVVTVVYQVQIGEIRGTMSICLPVGMLEPIIDKFNQSNISPTKPTEPQATAALLKTLSKVKFGVSAELESVKAAVSELMTLAEGDVLRSNHRVEKPLNVSVAGAVKFTGRIAAINSRVVLQVSENKQQRVLETAA